MKLVDVSGAEAASYEYDAWGNILSQSGSMASTNPLRYCGYYYDTETGFYYLQSRYYDPANHRFINADSHVSTDATDAINCNMFAYCSNNPIVFADYLGEAKVYVLYYDSDNGFYAQSHDSIYHNDNSVEYIAFTTTQDFIDGWNSMEGDIDEVYIYAHGGKGTLYFKRGGNMKHFVKALCIIILAVALFALVGFLIGFRINYVTDDGASAKLHYVDAETANALCVELSDPEKMHIIEILHGKIAFPDSPSCPFQYEISFEIGEKRYLPSLDDCRLIQIDNTGKYIKISEAEKSLLLSILEKYA